MKRRDYIDEEDEDFDENIGEKESDPEEIPQEINFHNTLSVLLSPYEPAVNELEADELWSTMQIISSLEKHYGICQGDPDIAAISGPKLVDALLALGYKVCNSGGTELSWMVKNKSTRGY
jgi:hypothetical protein